jgi:peptide/nickel transport system ATP-binding protein
VTLLSVSNLSTWFRTDVGVLRAVTDVSFELERGCTLGLVGESGSGKSVLTRSVIGIQPRVRLARSSGRVMFDGLELTAMSERELRHVWQRRISIVPQNPLSSLNPVLRVGTQLGEVLQQRFKSSRQRTKARAGELLEQVGISEPERRLRSYPHELSGGMRQRIAIAMALACEPELLVADEPTTALDVTVQAQILGLLRAIQQERNMAMIFVSHDLAVMGGLADEIAVMYAGRIVEKAPAKRLLDAPLMPYSEALMRSSPTLEQPKHTVLAVIPGRPANPLGEPHGCAFAPRCHRVLERCSHDAPPLTTEADGHQAACWNQVPVDGR